MDRFLELIRKDIHKWLDGEPNKYNITHLKYAVNDYICYINRDYHLMKHCPYHYTSVKKVCINNCQHCWLNNIRGDTNE